MAAGPVRCTVSRAACDAVFDDVGHSVERVEGPRRAQLAREADRQHPGRLVLAGQELAQLWRADEVLHHHHVGVVVVQRVHQLAVGGLVGGSQPVLVDQRHQQEVVVARFVKRLDHLCSGDARRCIAGQDGERMLLGHLAEGREASAVARPPSRPRPRSPPRAIAPRNRLAVAYRPHPRHRSLPTLCDASPVPAVSDPYGHRPHRLHVAGN